MLVVAAGLFVRTSANLHSVNLGFNAENVLIFNAQPILRRLGTAVSDNSWCACCHQLRYTLGRLLEQQHQHRDPGHSGPTCTCFGGLALLMACVGLYGRMAYAVGRGTSEIGIRMALVATRRRVIWMVLREVIVLSVSGLAIGLTAAYQTTSFVKSFLFCIKPNDPLAMSASAAILINLRPPRRIPAGVSSLSHRSHGGAPK